MRKTKLAFISLALIIAVVLFIDTEKIEASDSKLVIVNGTLLDGKAATGDIIIPDTVKTIDHDAFLNNKNITSVIIPDSVTTIKDSAFAFCDNLELVRMTDSVTTLGLDVFACCKSLTAVRLSNSIQRLEGETFFKCSSLKSITLPASVEKILPSAFRGCKKLRYVTVPKTLSLIGINAFKDCSKYLTFYGDPNSDISTYIDENKIKCKELTLIKTKATLNIGDRLQLYMNSYAKCTWKSSNDKVAAVSSTGKVTAKGKGKATITIELYGIKYKCTVTIK